MNADTPRQAIDDAAIVDGAGAQFLRNDVTARRLLES